jgi:ribonuclease HI
MFTIEIAASNNWSFIWLESDSMLVVKAFTSPYMVPWKIKNRWLNALHMTKSMHFMVTHIFREQNTCADKLTSIGLSVRNFIWWNEVHGTK